MAVPLQVNRVAPTGTDPGPVARRYEDRPAGLHGHADNAGGEIRRSLCGQAAPREGDSEHTLVFPAVEADSADEVAELRRENARLHELLDQARERLLAADREAEQWRSREAEYENILEEKSELIRQLHEQVEKAGSAAAPGGDDRRVPREEDLIALEQELLREREQLKQDEEALMAEMRSMEVQMARERADLARQRNELQRMHQQLKHELEIALRDGAMRDRLAPLQRLQEEIQKRHVGAEPARQHGHSADSTAGARGRSSSPGTNGSGKKTGFFRRLFGG